MAPENKTKKRILIVDDESIIRMLLSEVLSEAGYEVEISGDGIEAMERLKNRAGYDLIVLDVNMPKIDGINFCRQAVKDFPEIKKRFLFTTGHVSNDALAFFKENSCNYITKPFKMQDLLSRISAMLAKEETSARGDNGPKEGMERRAEERFHWTAYCQVFEERIYKTTPLIAKTQDISRNGVKIRYVGEMLPPGSDANIHIMNLNLRRAAKIMWAKAINELDTVAGLKFMEPIQLPAGVASTVSQ